MLPNATLGNSETTFHRFKEGRMSTRTCDAWLWIWCMTHFALAVPASATAQGGMAPINGERLNYEIAGEGAPLVLIHGWSLNLRMWDTGV